ncbi:MAG: DEAD/DEAH box helicase [Comamonadaceae bacterium]|nr:DEAD/DEAH box helicase [Comamonadaceae bacterium]
MCPTSLKYQWQSEIARFSGRAARVMAGGRAQRQKDFAADDFCKITNYEKLKPDLDLIAAWAPELVIVDEAQRIKNWNTIAARALKRIDSPYALRAHRHAAGEQAGGADLHRAVRRPAPAGPDLEAAARAPGAGRVRPRHRLHAGWTRSAQTLAPIMIRRRKAEVLRSCPSRTDQNLLVPMTEMQMRAPRGERRHRGAASSSAGAGPKLPVGRRTSGGCTCALQNMRMSCNSTYLLDQETDHGVKADELAALLDGLLRRAGGEGGGVQPVDCAPTTSSSAGWRRAASGYVQLPRRRAFGQAPARWSSASATIRTAACSCPPTPAAAGLNLQHASTLVNMDLPWNPALLEQRIGRIHRMGQTRPVQIVNFVAKGTIEEGMLSVLAFKRSLSAGILDGGSSEISLGGSRLSRFMKDVESVTGRMGEGEAMAPAEEAAGVAAAAGRIAGRGRLLRTQSRRGRRHRIGSRRSRAGKRRAPASQEPGADPWAVLLQAGAQLVSALSAAGDPAAARHPWIERDPASGARSLQAAAAAAADCATTGRRTLGNRRFAARCKIERVSPHLGGKKVGRRIDTRPSVSCRFSHCGRYCRR